MPDATVRVYADTKGPGRCRSCAAPITWAETRAGKRMPLEGHEPVPKSSEHSEDRRLIEVYDASDTHWANCPDAPDWKRKASHV